MKPILWLFCVLTTLYLTAGQDVAKVVRIWKVNSTENSLSLKYDPPDVPVNASICYCDPQIYTCNACKETTKEDDSWCKRFHETFVNGEVTLTDLRPSFSYVVVLHPPDDHEDFERTVEGCYQTEATAPEPVQITIVQPSYWGVNISWSVSSTSVTPDSYIVRVPEIKFSTEIHGRSYVVKNFKAETNYTIEIVAKKSRSDPNGQDYFSEPSSASVKTEPLPVPEPVEITSVQPSYWGVNISWSISPTSVIPDSFIVRVVGIDFSTETTNRSYVVKELQPETEYTIEIIAKKVGSDPNRREFFSEPRSVSVKTEPLPQTDSTALIVVAVSVPVIALIAGAAIFRWKIIRSRNRKISDQNVAYSRSSETVTTAPKM